MYPSNNHNNNNNASLKRSGFFQASTGKAWPLRDQDGKLLAALERCADLIEELLEALEGGDSEDEDLDTEEDVTHEDS